MFERFAQNKNRYAKGQIFPLLIVIIVVMVILAMITVNLGQLGVFRTDVSNAADAGALAGASVLSGSLLGFGLRSDSMTGEFIMTVVAIIIFLLTVIGAPAAIATAIAYYVGAWITVIQSFGEGRMAWSNAKKTALQYAFQNAGITEPPPTFEQFLSSAFGITEPGNLSAEELKRYYNMYAYDKFPEEHSDKREFSKTGFSRFMEHPLSGFAEPIGEIRPGSISPANVTSGYGWELRDDERIYNSYDERENYPPNYRDYHDYHHWVEVEVVGSVMYPLEPYTAGLTELENAICDYIDRNLDLPWWLEWTQAGFVIEHIIRPVLKVIVGLAIPTVPMGLYMDDEQGNTDDNPLMVTVRRSRGEKNLGLWRFRYGTTEAKATAHAFREQGDFNTIKPTLWASIWNAVSSLLDGGWWDWTLFNTSRHLFETKLTSVY